MAGQIQGADQFDLYFRRADLDGDGRISGAEAVSFFQGSNLPKNVLAQIWMHADQNHTGFLGRAEFYNALKLVTVAQSKRELTQDIVKAALFGPAAAKIPAPQINLAAIPAAQRNQIPAAPAAQIRAVTQTPSQNFGLRGQVAPNPNMNQSYLPSQQSQTMRPPQSIGLPVTTSVRPAMQGLGRGNSVVGPGSPGCNISSDWFSGKSGGIPPGTTPQDPNRGTNSPMSGTPSSKTTNEWFSGKSGGISLGPMPQGTNRGITSPMTSVMPQQQDLMLTSSQSAFKDSKTSAVPGNGFASGSVFGTDAFSAAPSLPKQNSNAPSYSASTPTSPGILPSSTAPQSPAKPGTFNSMQTAFTMQPAGGQAQRPQLPVNPNQHLSAQSSSLPQPYGVSAGPVNSTANQAQIPWPKMKPSDVQKYTKVFVEVDSDRDGKITGEQARNLFMSWRLPREVLKQVWDLSDQDNDSMLSLREFCIALYLMERYREGRPLPAALPSNMFDETPSISIQPAASYGNANWGPSPGLRQQPGIPGAYTNTPSAALRPPMPVTTSPQPNESGQPDQKKRESELEDEDPFAHFGNRKQKPQVVQEEKDTNKKIEGPENVVLGSKEKTEVVQTAIMDSKEKIEFYRTMMQELVLYKSRCDNRLNEIIERALADKREAESLGKKYEERYKQVADMASKLTIEEAKFRDVQERKMELQQAIVKMEQGGSADGLLQVRADRIQSDVDELMKALTERCKKHGLNIKSAALFELPQGWQPGIQEGAVVWDEEWDKFEDEGFSFAKGLKLDSQNNTASAKSDSTSVWVENDSPKRVTPGSTLNVDGKSEKLFLNSEHGFENDSAYSHGEDDLGRSSPDSPAGRTSMESPSREFSDIHSRKSTEADTDIRRSFDEPGWGTFDTNEDMDSVWGFNTKDANSENRDSFYGSGDLGLNPVRTESPESSTFQQKSPFMFADSVPSTPFAESDPFQKKSTSVFLDSVPSTPMSKFGNSPPRYNERSFFDSSSRFDSFSVQDGGYSPRCETFTRFDSTSSTNDFGQSGAFASFDDADPFGSTGPFKVSSDSPTSRRDSENWKAS